MLPISALENRIKSLPKREEVKTTLDALNIDTFKEKTNQSLIEKRKNVNDSLNNMKIIIEPYQKQNGFPKGNSITPQQRAKELEAKILYTKSKLSTLPEIDGKVVDYILKYYQYEDIQEKLSKKEKNKNC